MRKQLMAGTALAAAAMLAAGGALAADKKMMKPSISVNGSFDALVGGVLDESMEMKRMTHDAGAGNFGDGGNTDLTDDTMTASKKDVAGDTSAVDTRTDAEIHFNGRAATDNGMKYHMRVELEGQQGSGERIDEYFLSVSGAFGQVIFGGTGGAPVKMLTGLSGSWATGVGETLNFDQAWTPSAVGRAGHYPLQHARLDTGDANKLTYISPKLGGFQVGLSYAGNKVNDDDSSRVDADAGVHDGFELAASYTGKFGDVGFGAGAGMTTYQGCNGPKAMCDDTGESDWLVAGRIDFGGGFRIAAAHKRVTNEDKMDESSLTDVGVRFIQGANSFSLVASHGEMEHTDAAHTGVMASYARALGPGVKWHANLMWMDSTSAKSMSDNATPASQTIGDDGNATPVPAVVADERYVDQTENSGMAFVTGIKVSF